MSNAGQGDVQIVPVMTGFRSTVDNEVEATGKTSSNRFATAFGNGIKGLGAFVGKSLAVAGGLAAGIAAIAVKGGISRQLQIEEATAKMAGLGNSTDTVKSAMDSALAAVKGTAFGMGEAATVASTALASGIKPGQEMSKYLTLVADAATIAGTGMGEMGQIMGKVTNSGKVTNDVLNQFGDRGVGVLQMLAKHYGVTAEEMTSMVSKGKVDAETFNKVLTENIGGAAQKSGDTTTGAWKNVLAALSRVGVTLSGWFFPLVKKIFNQVTLVLDGVNEKIKPVADAFAIWFQGKAGPAIESFSANALAAFSRLFAGVLAFVLGFQLGMSNVDTSSPAGHLQRFGAIAGSVFKEIRGGVWAFQASWQAFDGDVTSSGFPGFMERLAFVTKTAFTEMRGGVWAFQAAWAANDGDITSSGFPGFMERAAFFVRGLVDAVRMLDFTSVQGFFASVGPSSSQAGSAFASIGSSLVALGPAFTAFGEQLPVITGALVKLGGLSLNVLVGGLAFLAAHVDTIIAWMPAIVTGFIAWRIAASALAVSQYKLQMASAASAPVLLANSIIRFAAVRAETALSVAQGRSTATQVASTSATNAGWLSTIRLNVATAAQALVSNQSAGATARMTVASVAARVATVAGTVATGVATAAQWAFNVAMSANPIGLIILAIVALIAGIVLLVMNWDTVVGFLKGTWQGFVGWFQDAIANVVTWVKGHWGILLSLLIGPLGLVIQWIVDNWSGIVDTFAAGWSKVTSFFSTAWQVIKVIFATAWEAIQTIIATVLAVMIALVTGQWDKIPGYFVSIFQKIGGFFAAGLAAINAILNGALTGIIAWVVAIWEGLVTWVQSIPQRFIDALIGLALLGVQVGAWILAVKDAAVAKFLEMVNWVMGVPDMVINGLVALALLYLRVGAWILSVRDAAVSKFLDMVNWVMGVPGMVLNGLGSIANLAVTMAVWIGGVKDAGIRKFFELVDWVGGLPGRILAALGNMGTLLWDAGNVILGGFLNGLKAGFKGVQDFVGGIGDWIKDHKGPEAYDRALLVPAGGWIMGGLTKSMRAGIPDLKGTLNSVSATIRAGITGPDDVSVGARGQGQSIATKLGGTVIHGPLVEVNPSAGMSEEHIGDSAAEQLLWKMRGVLV